MRYKRRYDRKLSPPVIVGPLPPLLLDARIFFGRDVWRHDYEIFTACDQSGYAYLGKCSESSSFEPAAASLSDMNFMFIAGFIGEPAHLLKRTVQLFILMKLRRASPLFTF